MKKMKTLSIAALLILIACGEHKAKSGAGDQAVTNEFQPEGSTSPEIEVDISAQLDAQIEGQYLAVFDTLNPKVTPKLTGAFTFSREVETDEVVGDVRLTNAGAALLHAQYVRLGTRCPTLQDDTNADGIIDAIEGEAVYGKVLFPLDGDLSTQRSLDNYFPVGDQYGNYYYSEVAKFRDFMTDLRDTGADDGYVKLKRNESLGIEGRVVVVHGVDPTTVLPATVRTHNRLANHQTLPIVCGVVKKVTSVPGTIND